MTLISDNEIQGSSEEELTKNFEIPAGYKMTDLGILPQEWQVSPLQNCLLGTPTYGINAPAVPYQNILPKYIRITDITEDGKFSTKKLSSVNANTNVIEKYLLTDGDLVFARTGASVGKSYLYNLKDGRLVFAGFLIKAKPDQKSLLSSFLALYVKTHYYKNWVQLISMRSGQPGINGNEYGQLPIPLPVLQEQQAIAAALSDIDSHIDSLNQLIVKKRNIKLAAMQQLLTGKQRLPGFSGEWELKRFGDVLKVRHGKSQKEVEVINGKYPILASGGEIGRTNHYLYDKPSVLIGRKGTIDSPQYMEKPFWTVDTLFFTEISNYALPKFVFYKFNMVSWRIYSEASGVPSLNASTIEGIEFIIPNCLEEQRAIAQILSDMDVELSVLEAQLAKTRNLKQGMMQELLTGRIRLK